MNIGIDVDGVLTDLEKFQLENGKKYFGENSVVNDKAYDIQEIFNCSKAKREKFWTKYIWNYCLKEKVSLENREYIKKIKEEGNKIYIITGRVHTTKNNFMGKLFRKMLIRFLEKNEIPYDEIIYCNEKNSAEDKLEICKKYNIDVMFEDKVENIKAIKDIAKVICFNAKYNEDYVDSDVVRVSNNNFKEAYFELKKIENEIDSRGFRVLHEEEVQKLNNDEKIKYYEDLKKYYMNLPYDYKKMEKMEKKYKFYVKLGIPFFKLLYKPIIFNKEFIPKNGNCIFVSNHLGSFDQFPIMAAIEDNRPIHFMVASTLLDLKRGKLYEKTGSIFVDRENPSSRHEAKELMKQILVNDGNIFMFPEGTRNRTDKYMLDFKKGAVDIAKATGAKIVPFAINDNYKGSNKNNPLMVRVGEPMEIKPDDNIEQKTNELKEKIATMIWENMEEEKSIVENNKKSGKIK